MRRARRASNTVREGREHVKSLPPFSWLSQIYYLVGMKCLPLTIFFVAFLSTLTATPTTAVERPASELTRTELRAKRKAIRQESRAARKAGAARSVEQRLARRSSIALLFSILSIPLTLFTVGLILLGTMPYTRKTLTAYLYNPEVEVGYQRARAARFIAVGLTTVIVGYLMAAVISVLVLF